MSLCMLTDLGKLYATARMGLKVVPFMINHPEHGVCMIEMDGDGMKAKSLKSSWEKYTTWEEMDNA